MNRVILIGRICSDIEMKTANDLSVARLRIAVDRKGQKDTSDFIGCVAFGKTADFINKYFTKGKKICVEGHIQTGSYAKQDGTKVYTTDVIIETVEFVESASEVTRTKVDDGSPWGR